MCRDNPCSFIKERRFVEVDLCISLTEDILRRNKLFVMSRLCSECSLFRRSNAEGKTSLLSYAADKCYSTTRKSLSVMGTERSLSCGEREDGNGESGRKQRGFLQSADTLSTFMCFS